MPTTAGDIVYAALRAAGVLTQAGRGASPGELADGIAHLNRLIDQWAARKLYAYSTAFRDFTSLTPGHQPHRIGPGLAAPEFDAPRPVRIESAALVLPGGLESPIAIRDAAWWAGQRVKGLATDAPTDLYYAPDAPAGSIYLWPVPNSGYGLRLQVWVSLEKVTDAATEIAAPPAYEDALVWTLAERLAPVFGLPVRPDVREEARRARAALQSNNAKSPRISAIDFGARRGGFNYYTGQ